LEAWTCPDRPTAEHALLNESSNALTCGGRLR
jgi:hypothetical protein